MFAPEPPKLSKRKVQLAGGLWQAKGRNGHDHVGPLPISTENQFNRLTKAIT
jgi:hypothetical protein